MVPAGYRSTYPYDPSGRLPSGEDAPFPDPLIWLAYVARADIDHPAGHRHPDPPRAQPGGPGQGAGHARLPVVRAGHPRGRHRLAEGGVRGRRRPLRASWWTAGGERRRHAGPVGRRTAPPSRARTVNFTGRLPAAPAPGRDDPDPHRRPHRGRRPAGGTHRRRLLPLRRRPGRAPGPTRDHASRRRGGRPGPFGNRGDGDQLPLPPTTRRPWPTWPRPKVWERAGWSSRPPCSQATPRTRSPTTAST